MDKIEIIIRHTSAGQTQQFYGVNHYEPEEALRRFHSIGSEANDMHLRLMQDGEMELSPTPDLLESLKAILADEMSCHKAVYEFGGFVLPDELRNQALAAIAKAERRGE